MRASVRRIGKIAVVTVGILGTAAGVLHAPHAPPPMHQPTQEWVARPGAGHLSHGEHASPYEPAPTKELVAQHASATMVNGVPAEAVADVDAIRPSLDSATAIVVVMFLVVVGALSAWDRRRGMPAAAHRLRSQT